MRNTDPSTPSFQKEAQGTCSNGTHHGLNGEIEGIVPGANDEDHAHGLRVDVAFILLGLGSLLHRLIQNPLRELLECVLDLLQAIYQFLVVRIPFVLWGEGSCELTSPRALSGELPGPAVGAGSLLPSSVTLNDLLPFPNLSLPICKMGA